MLYGTLDSFDWNEDLYYEELLADLGRHDRNEASAIANLDRTNRSGKLMTLIGGSFAVAGGLGAAICVE